MNSDEQPKFRMGFVTQDRFAGLTEVVTDAYLRGDLTDQSRAKIAQGWLNTYPADSGVVELTYGIPGNEQILFAGAVKFPTTWADFENVLGVQYTYLLDNEFPLPDGRRPNYAVGSRAGKNSAPGGGWAQSVLDAYPELANIRIGYTTVRYGLLQVSKVMGSALLTGRNVGANKIAQGADAYQGNHIIEVPFEKTIDPVFNGPHFVNYTKEEDRELVLAQCEADDAIVPFEWRTRGGRKTVDQAVAEWVNAGKQPFAYARG